MTEPVPLATQQHLLRYPAGDAANPEDRDAWMYDAASGQWLPKHQPLRSAREYGAAGDGAADDTSALQDALNAAGGTLWIPAGTYLTGPLTISSALDVALDPGATLRLASGSNVHLLTVNAAGTTIRGGVFNGNKAGQTATSYAISILASDCVVEDTEIRDTYSYGIRVHAASRCRITGNSFVDTGSIALFAQASPTVGAHYNLLSGNTVRGTDFEGGIKVHGYSATVTSVGNRITDNHVENPAQICIEAHLYAPKSVITGNITTGGMMGVSVSSSDDSTVTANAVEGPSSYCIELAASRRCTVTGNTADGKSLSTRGIALTNTACEANTITSNTIRSIAGRAIELNAGAANGVVSQNIIDGYTGYGISAIASDYTTISENVLLSGGTKCIVVDNSKYVSVLDNIGRTATEHGLFLYQSGEGVVDNITARGNHLSSTGAAFGEQGTIGADVLYVDNRPTTRDRKSAPAQAVGAFHAYAASDQPDIPNTSFTKVLFPSEEADVSGWFASSRYTPQEAGYYSFQAAVSITPAVADRQFYVSLFKNGARYKDLASQHTSSASSLTSSGSAERVYANGATDYFEIFVWHNFGVATSDILGRQFATYFSGGFEGTV